MPNHIKIVLVAGLALGGCQSWLDHAGSAWNWSERNVTRGWQEVVSALRPAPKARDMFLPVGAETGDAMLNTPLLEARLLDRWTEPEPVKVAVNRTMDNGVMVVRPGMPARTLPMPHTPAFDAEPPPGIHIRGQQSVSSDPFAYVRLDGPTDMADWQACETETGGAFIVSPSGAEIAGDFDACMRGRGYMPEREAERRLKEQAGERLAGG